MCVCETKAENMNLDTWEILNKQRLIEFIDIKNQFINKYIRSSSSSKYNKNSANMNSKQQLHHFFTKQNPTKSKHLKTN